MEWPMRMDFGDGLFVNGKVTLNSRNGEVLIEFLDEKGDSFLIDTLSKIRTIQFDDSNPLKITLNGDDIHRVFYLQSEDAVSNMWTFFQNHQKLKPLPGSHKIFAVMPKKTIQFSQKISFQPFRSSSTPTLSRPSFSSTPEALAHGMIRETLSDFKQITVTEKNFNEIFKDNKLKSDYSQSGLDVSPNFVIDCWRKLLNIEKFETDDFLKLKKQWKNIDQNIWESDSRLRFFVSNSQRNLENQKFNIEGGEEIAFNALISYFIESMNTLKYEDFLVSVATLITNSLLAGRNGELYILQSGDEATQDECSAIVYTLLEHISGEINGIWDNLYDDTIQLLFLTSNSTANLLSHAQVKDFEFMRQEIGYLFCKDRNQEDSVLLFTAALSSHSMGVFVRSLIASCFTLLHHRLVEIVDQGHSFFCSTFLCLIPSINTRVLVEDTKFFSEFLIDGNIYS